MIVPMGIGYAIVAASNEIQIIAYAFFLVSVLLAGLSV